MFFVYVYKYVFNTLKKHVIFFEMNLMNIKHPIIF
jgi:hypothetical protein